MKKCNNLKVIAAVLLSLSLLIGASSLSSCKNTDRGDAESTPTETNPLTPPVDVSSMDLEFSKGDLDDSYDTGNATFINLAGEEPIVLTEAGTYILSGWGDMGVIVNAPADAKLRIVLDGIRLTNESGPAINIKQADKVFLILPEGSINTLTGGDGESSLDGAIFSKADLTINGKGALTVDGKYKHGIVSKDDLVITGGNISVTSKSVALAGKDCVKIGGGTITLDAGSDGIRSDNTEDASRGFVYVKNGKIDITAEDDGIHAETALIISGGNINIKESCEGLESADINISGGNISIIASDDGLNASSGEGSEPFRPGGVGAQTSSSSVSISGGYVFIDASGDGIDSNGNISISGGVTLISGPTNNGNSAFDYDGQASVSGGVLVALGPMGMMQGFSSAENQGAILTPITTQSAGTSFALCNKDGKAVVSFTSQKPYQSVLVTAPAIKQGETYTVVVGGEVSGADANGYALDAEISGGGTVATIEMQYNVYHGGGNMGGGDHGGGPEGGRPQQPPVGGGDHGGGPGGYRPPM